MKSILEYLEHGLKWNWRGHLVGDLPHMRQKVLDGLQMIYKSEEAAVAGVEEAKNAKAWKTTTTKVTGRQLRDGDKVRLKVVTITNVSNSDKDFCIEEGDFSREERDRFDFSMIDEVVEYVESHLERHDRLERENHEMREIIKNLDPEYYAKHFA